MSALPSRGKPRRDDRGQRDCVSLLVENVRRKDEIERTRRQAAVLPPVGDDRGQRKRVPGGVLLEERDCRRSPIGRNHVGAEGSGDERRQAEPTAELEHAATGQSSPAKLSGKPAKLSGKPEPARPELGPVRKKLVVAESGLVDQALGIVGSFELRA